VRNLLSLALVSTKNPGTLAKEKPRVKMGTVRSLNPTQGLEEFCNFLYGEEEGYIHAPVKRDDNYEYDFFFKWPAQRQDLLDHVARYTKSAEVYITPGMFKGPSSSVTNSHGSYVAWADFDGNVPALEELEDSGVPHPTLRVQSSVTGREHWYWKYEQFNTDIASIQSINKAICYALEGDTGAWDAGHSLRPVGTINHKRGGLPVTIKTHNDNRFKVEDFSSVPVPEESYNLEQFRRENIPSFLDVLMKFTWPDEARSLIRKKGIKEGSRSSALAALAYYACESGADNSEVYSILLWKDRHWQKFFNRVDKERYYVDLINYARQKVPYEGIKDTTVLADEIKTYSFKEVIAHVDDTEWIIEGLLPRKGIGYIVGRPGTGKTTLALGLSTCLCVNKNYLDWFSNEGKEYKVLYLSLEMTLEDVNQFYVALQSNFTDDEVDRLDKNFHTYASPEKIKFYQSTSPIMGKFLRKLENMRPDIVLVDSASYSLASNLSAQDEVTKSIEVLDMIRDRYGCAFLFVHHARKDPPGHGYREADLDDMFGSVFIAASAASIIALKQNKDYEASNGLMDIRYLKSRFSADNTGFSVVMNGDKRMFRKPVMGAIAPVPKQEKKEEAKTGESFFNI
jgi:KaiC/GvpD/RAD55 family RecA-like ATPase